MSERPRLTMEDYEILARAIPEVDGWYEMEWSAEEIDRAEEALEKIRALVEGPELPDVDAAS